MARFIWKRHKDIFKGVGIYHLTFVVRDREPLLGRLVDAPQAPRVERTPLGTAIARTIEYLPVHYKGLKIIGKCIMPDHVHLVLHLYEDYGYSIKEIARGLRQAWRKDYARSMECAAPVMDATAPTMDAPSADINRQILSAEPYKHSAQSEGTETGAAQGEAVQGEAAQGEAAQGEAAQGEAAQGEAAQGEAAQGEAVQSEAAQGEAAQGEAAQGEAVQGEAAQGEAVQGEAAQGEAVQSEAVQGAFPAPQPLFDAPYIRTLARKGQLDAMVRYIHDNPRRAMLRRQHPDLFTLRRDTRVGTCSFSSLGNLFLLDYPDKQAIICSRSLSESQIAAQQTAALDAAENGCVTVTAAISPGERQIARAIREAGLPLVILLKDGFPKAGDEHERYYKPGGVYFEACAAGRLLLLEPTADTLTLPDIQAHTEQTLREKAEAKHFTYQPLPLSSDRYRMMAANEIVKQLCL